MYVRLKTGRQAGQIVDLRYDAATALTSSGQADRLSQEEIAAHKAAEAAKLRQAERREDPQSPGTVVHEVKSGTGIGCRIVISETPGAFDVLREGRKLNARPLALSEAQILAANPEVPPAETGTGGEGKAGATDWREAEAGKVEIPENWRDLNGNDQRSLAAQLTTEKVTNKDLAAQFIEREIAHRAANPEAPPAAT